MSGAGRTWLTVAGVWTLALGGGCACQVRVWANSDTDDPRDYTVSSPHYIHVGETTQFRVTVEPDIADYVLMDFGGSLATLNRVGPGQYAYSKRFDRAAKEKVSVKAYRQVGRRDVVERRGRIVRQKRFGDDADQVLGSGNMVVRCYQSKVAIRVPGTGKGEPDWARGRLEILGPGAKVTRVGYGASGKGGFVVLGPTAVGKKYVVYYQPKHDQVRRAGQTQVVFTFVDGQGKKIVKNAFIDTR